MSKPELTKNNKTKITAESGKQELEIIREFDAPRELVFKAYTDPDLYRQWLGPRRLKMNLEKLSLQMAVLGDMSIVMKMEMNMHFMECITKLLAQRGLSARLNLKVYQNLDM
jgi:uncharacterized protein YndB with AHSA1/START domain